MPNVFGNAAKRHLEERQGVDEVDSVVGELHQFGTVADLLEDTLLSVIFIEDEQSVLSLKIMSNDGERARLVFRQSIQPLQKRFDAVLFSKRFGVVVVFRFSHDKIRDVAVRILHGLDIKKDVKWGFLFLFLHVHALIVCFQRC